MRRKILGFDWFGQIFDDLLLVGKICPSMAIYVILEARPVQDFYHIKIWYTKKLKVILIVFGLCWECFIHLAWTKVLNTDHCRKVLKTNNKFNCQKFHIKKKISFNEKNQKNYFCVLHLAVSLIELLKPQLTAGLYGAPSAGNQQSFIGVKDREPHGVRLTS